MRWDVMLYADDESQISAVRHNGKPLSYRNGAWPVTSFAGRLSIDIKGSPSTHVSLYENSPLIFKLNKDWSGDGRQITRLTKGHFIVIAPVEWVRFGHVPVEPDGCSDSEFMAHYFFRDGSESAEELGDFQGREIDLSAPRFNLRGTRVFDDSEKGDLFVESPPRLTIVDRVVWARVGEEEQGGWKGENFKPSERSLAEVMGARQGRFFLRLYDAHRAILDGAQFRYLSGLREIRVNGEPYSENMLLVPTATGHASTTVQFIGADDVKLNATLPPGAVRVEDGISGFVVGPHAEADEVACSLEADGGRVDIALHLPRIWWRMEREGVECDGEWRSTPFEMTRHGFRECADSNTMLRLRLPKQIRSVAVGFGDERGIRYASRENDLQLPLAHFADHVLIDDWLGEDALFNVRLNSTSSGHRLLPLIRIIADPPECVKYKLRRAVTWEIPGIFPKWRKIPAGTVVTLKRPYVKRGTKYAILIYQGQEIKPLSSDEVRLYGKII